MLSGNWETFDRMKEENRGNHVHEVRSCPAKYALASTLCYMIIFTEILN